MNFLPTSFVCLTKTDFLSKKKKKKKKTNNELNLLAFYIILSSQKI